MAPAELEPIFAALADPARLGVIALLREQPLRSSQIARQLALSRPLASKHLGVLRKAGLIEERPVGADARARLYQLRRDAFSQVRGWLDEVEQFWSAQLDAFKRYAERAAPLAPSKRRARPRATAKAKTRAHAARQR